MNKKDYDFVSQSLSKKRLDCFKRPTLLNLIVILIHLVAFVFFGILIWNSTIKWVTANSLKFKIIWFCVCLILMAIVYIISLSLISFIQLLSKRQTYKLICNITKFNIFPDVSSMTFKKRLLIVMGILPGILSLNIGFVVSILVFVSTISILRIDNLHNLITIAIVIFILLITNLFLFFLQINIAHWIVTGKAIRKMYDITDWSLRQ